jgi:nucleosome binding factor SPN SPT16 subunit
MEEKITELISGNVNREFVETMNTLNYNRNANRKLLKQLAKLDDKAGVNSEFYRAEKLKVQLKNKLIDKRNKQNANE